MSQITKDINKITGTIIGVSGKLILYALILLLLTEGIVRGYAFGHAIFYQTPMEPTPGSNKVLTVTAEDSGLTRPVCQAARHSQPSRCPT